MVTSSEISGRALRERFLAFFEKNAHTRVKSAPLVPQGDDTLLFVNAGMVQFKDVFTGRESRDYSRATSSQKCVRAGGKHNDLENVGRTARHHTFFEMLGNFSFGDYFKEEACKLAWRFLVDELGIDDKRLTVTVFGGEDGIAADEEAERIWHEVVGVPQERISRHGKKDNFWAMGDTGPCGPCTEIHYDRGAVEGAFGGDDPEGDQVLEVWNLVFMQYERHKDGSMTALPKPSVDTGMGLERLAMVMGGFASNYDTDLLRPLITFSEQRLGKKYTSTDGDDDVAMRVIADHARTTAMLIADGVSPSNEGRGYVLKAIMRRAILFGDMLGFSDLFLADACGVAIEMFAEAYPELGDAKQLIHKTADAEEKAFRSTLKRGLEQFSQVTSGMKKGDVISGDDAFDLHATHGFPFVMTELMAQEKGFAVDKDGFDTANAKHAEVSSGGGLGVEGVADVYKGIAKDHGATAYLGYECGVAEGKVVALLKDLGKDLPPEPVDALSAPDKGFVVLDRTPLYGESGGQIGDTGRLVGGEFYAQVTDTQKQAGLHVHAVKVQKHTVKVGDTVEAGVDTERLAHIKRNHSATHLLHKALRDVLGDHVAQKGSLVAPDRLRFDFSHFEPMTAEQVQAVEDRVNDEILHNHARGAEVMSFDAAKEKGAMALFGEKYGDEVRVVSMGDSVELCGGVHVERTGDIGLFKITSEGPLASGVRRLEAVTGKGALRYVRERTVALGEVAKSLGVPELSAADRVEKLKAELKAKEKELQKFAQQAATASAADAVGRAQEVSGIKVLTERVEQVDPKAMREYADKLRDKLQSGVVVLGRSMGDKKVTLLVALTQDLAKKKLHAGKIVGELAAVVGGKGGGKPDFAQAGGNDPANLDKALAKAIEVIGAQAG